MVKITSLPMISVCNYRIFKPGEMHITRRMQDYVLIFMLGGELHFTENGKAITLVQGQWYLQEKELFQSANRPSDTAHYFYAHFSCIAGHEVVLEMERQGKFLTEDYRDYFDQLIALSHRSGIEKISYERCFLDMIKQMMVSSQKTADRKSILATRVFHIVEEHFNKDDMAKLLEEHLHLSYHYLYKITKKYKGKSPIQYMHQLRINKAKELLSNTNDTVEEIAFGVGFNDLSVFYKAFKKQTQLAPNKWRVESRRR